MDEDDDHFNSLTPLENLDDTLLFHYDFPQEEIANTLEDLVVIPNHPSLPAPAPAPASSTGNAGGSTAAGGDENSNGRCSKSPVDDDHNKMEEKKKKKIVHRDVERQRRQEMANYYSSLRTILPIEYIKGKRSMWEHVDGAVNHIKKMENNIKQLKVKKDKLMINLSELANNNNNNNGDEESIIQVSPPEITVTTCSNGGVEIVVGGIAVEEGDPIPLSRVLRVLLEEGVGVESCVSSKVKGKFYYTLLTEDQPTDVMTGNNLCSLLQQSFAQKLVSHKS